MLVVWVGPQEYEKIVGERPASAAEPDEGGGWE